MKFFNIFKKNQPLPGKELIHPSIMLLMELEYASKEACNLFLVGRHEEAKKVLDSFLIKIIRDSSCGTTSKNDLLKITYYIAYTRLPELIFKNWDEFISLWNGNLNIGTYLLIEAALKNSKRLDLKQINLIKHFNGSFDSYEYYLFDFLTLSGDDYISISSSSEKRIQPMTYFLIVLYDKKNHKKSVFTLSGKPQARFIRRLSFSETEFVNSNLGLFTHPPTHQLFVSEVCKLL